MIVQTNEWKRMCVCLMASAGVSEGDAETIADAAITADLRGVSSHGTVRLIDYYNRIKAGLINPHPDIKIVNDSETLVRLDGDNGPGQVVMNRAAQEAVRRAKRFGCCAVSVFHTNHMGMLSYYALHAVRENMAVNIMADTPPFVAAYGGAEPALGTNPICWAVPGDGFPIVMDMAISPARGKIKNAAAKGAPIPEGWAVDRDGHPTTDARQALDGVLLPFGGVKGYGIGVIVELLTGVLSGGSFGMNIPHPLDDYTASPNLGNLIAVADIGKLMPPEQFQLRTRQWIESLKNSKKAQGFEEILLPGEIEHRLEQRRRAEGLEVSPEYYEKIAGMLKSAGMGG